MNYKVSYDALDNLYHTIAQQSSAWQEQLTILNGKIKALSESGNVSGQGADHLKAYLQSVHLTLISMISELIALHSSNCLVYKTDYQRNIDQDLHAVLVSNEMAELAGKLRSSEQSAIGIDDRLRYALSGVSDIFSVWYRDITDVVAAHRSAEDFITELNEQICNLEQSHSESDFISTGEMISSISAFLREMMEADRSFRVSFSPQCLGSSQSFQRMYQSHLQVHAELNEKMDAISAAAESESVRAALLDEEYENRRRNATITNWVVTGVFVVGSVAAIVATGGAATPLVIGGISAVSGAVIAGTNNLTSQYVEYGNLIENRDQIDWGAFGVDTLIGGVTGFVTGYVGAGASQAITSGLSSTAVGSSLLNSQSAVVRIGTGAVIGSASEVGSGIISRGAGTLISSEGDVDEALQSAFNLDSIVYDAAIGGVSGGLRSAQDPPVGKKMQPNDFDRSIMESKPNHSPLPEKWMEKGGNIYVDGNNVWTYEAPDGVHVCYSDGYPDFKRAGLVKQEVDIGSFSAESGSRYSDFKKADSITAKSPDTTWHHSQDGHTLQAVDTYYHKKFTHRGGFSIAKNGG